MLVLNSSTLSFSLTSLYYFTFMHLKGVITYMRFIIIYSLIIVLLWKGINYSSCVNLCRVKCKHIEIFDHNKIGKLEAVVDLKWVERGSIRQQFIHYLIHSSLNLSFIMHIRSIRHSIHLNCALLQNMIDR